MALCWLTIDKRQEKDSKELLGRHRCAVEERLRLEKTIIIHDMESILEYFIPMLAAMVNLFELNMGSKMKIPLPYQVMLDSNLNII